MVVRIAIARWNGGWPRSHWKPGRARMDGGHLSRRTRDRHKLTLMATHARVGDATTRESSRPFVPRLASRRRLATCALLGALLAMLSLVADQALGASTITRIDP